MDDIPWLYVAMIFIAFLSWVHNRIQEAKEYRRARKIEKEKAARARRTTEPPEFQSPYRGESRPSATPVVVEEEAEPPKTFREVFQELERQFTEVEAPEPETTRLPPPLPEPAPATYEQPALPTEPLVVAPPIAGKTSRKSSRNTGRYLVKTLRDGGSLKTALLLKEVLDKPRALRSR